MSVNEDSLAPTSESFWEIDGYKATVKRQEDGVRLCNDLMSLIQERAEIEKAYAKNLQNWSKKWMQTMEKSPEYGTTQAGWKAVLHEADSLAQVHMTIRENLLTEVHSKIKEWKLANYKKPVVGVCKETKQLEEEFKKAQKPWAKKYTKVKEARKQYHNACKMERSITNQENNAKADSSMSADQLKKIQEKSEKCRREVELTRQKYEAALTDLNNYNSKYMEDMVMVFEKSDMNEERRLLFFKEMMFGIHKCLDLSQNVELPTIYNQLYHTIDQANYKQDLKWWSQNYGKDMAMNWPQFEEFREDLHDITRQKSRECDAVGEAGILLRHISTDRYHKEFAEYQESHHSISRKEKSKSHHIGGSDGIMLTGMKTENSRPPSTVDAIAPNGSSNPTEDDTPPQPSPRLQRLKSYDSTLNPFTAEDDDNGNKAGDAPGAAVDPPSASTDTPSKSPENSPAKCMNIPCQKNIPDITMTPTTPLKRSPRPSSQAGRDKNSLQDYDNSLNPFGDDDGDDDDGADDGQSNKGGSSALASEEASTKLMPVKPHMTPPSKPPRAPLAPHCTKKTENYETDINENSGVPVRALYDYVGVDSDELSFKEGDVFRKLEDRDAQGWCTGYKDGKVGFYPDNYVELL